MKSDLVSIDTARIAYSKGYTKKTRPYYDNNTGKLVYRSISMGSITDFKGKILPCPTVHELQRYLRERYSIHVIAYPSFVALDKYLYLIFKGGELLGESWALGSYEKALDEGLISGFKFI